jgi:hypothetical protein
MLGCRVRLSRQRRRENSCIANRHRWDATTRARPLSSMQRTLFSCANAGDRSCRRTHSTTATLGSNEAQPGLPAAAYHVEQITSRLTNNDV